MAPNKTRVYLKVLGKFVNTAQCKRYWYKWTTCSREKLDRHRAGRGCISKFWEKLVVRKKLHNAKDMDTNGQMAVSENSKTQLFSSIKTQLCSSVGKARRYRYRAGCWRATKRGCISKFWGKFVVLQKRQNAKQGFRVSSFRSRVSGSRHRLIRFRVSGLKNLRLRLDLWSYPGARQL